MITRGATSWASIRVRADELPTLGDRQRPGAVQEAAGRFRGEPLQLLLRMLVVLRWRSSSMFGNGQWEVDSLFGCLRAELFAGVISLRGGRCQGCL
jgi:hypothetical protein